MDNWSTFSQDHAYDRFWLDNKPAFHTYDYRANIKSRSTKNSKNFPWRRVCDRKMRMRTKTRILTLILTPTPTPTPSLIPPLILAEIEIIGAEEQTMTKLKHHHRRAAEHSTTAWLMTNAGTNDGNQEHLYSGGLEHLRTELEKKYNIDNIDQISYALAADVNYIERTPNRSSDGGQNTSGAVSLLADRRKLIEHYGGLRGFTFYPLAFHPRYGNFSSPRPPRFLDDICLVMRDNISYRNNGAKDVLSFGYFHAYSNIKRTIRSRPEDLLPARGIATGALTLPPSEACQRAHIRARQQRLLRTLSGEQTPEQPGLSIPHCTNYHW